MPVKNDLRVTDNLVEWYNGEKWLIKETCDTNEQAQSLLEELQDR